MTTRTGALIKAKRKLLKLKMYEVADKIGVSTQHLCNWERGAALVPGPHVTTLCKVLKLHPRTLVDKTMEDLREKYYDNI